LVCILNESHQKAYQVYCVTGLPWHSCITPARTLEAHRILHLLHQELEPRMLSIAATTAYTSLHRVFGSLRAGYFELRISAIQPVMKSV